MWCMCKKERYWYIERREYVVFKICFSAQTRMDWTILHIDDWSATPTDSQNAHDCSSAPQAGFERRSWHGREIYRPWVIAAGRFTVRRRTRLELPDAHNMAKIYSQTWSTGPQSAKRLARLAPSFNKDCHTLCDQVRSTSALSALKKTFSRQPAR